MHTEEENKLIHGNVLISLFMFGNPEKGIGDYIPVAYTRSRTAVDGTKVPVVKLFRKFDDLCSRYQDNYHNSFDFLAPVVCKIAKDYAKVEAFSAEQVRLDEIRDSLFEDAYDPMITWEKIVSYLEYKNKKQSHENT